MAVQSGADALGLVFFEKSPRCVTSEQAATIVSGLPPFVQVVGLFVNAPLEYVNATAERCRLDLIQLHGEESPSYCDAVTRRVMKAFRVRGAESLAALSDYRVAGYLLDAYSPNSYGGTGERFDWDLASAAKGHGPIILAGGLTPDNVALAVSSVSPYAVDVSSGVEAAPGRKDPEKVRAFVRNAKTR
ncbi:N-(5'-phosphoribosyl)anthranilate isomerase [Geomonas limicola]|uniref:N-(5'-phosphoribosyl)anthranilate isomerase n=2 Tax=Geomonas limicola TaxID=2740186 RepID=A0A6V8NDJ3_9BACT|nr:N-(5'-phosphoribosyl)anthranilate isomerase [Geomonas limicola]